MVTFDISEPAKRMLHSYGWSEERQVDIRAIVTYLKNQSIIVSPIAEDFLRAFSGLHLDRLYLELPNSGLSEVKFDVTETMTFLADGDLTQLEALTGSSLCPVGYGGRFLLFLSPRGEMIFLHDEWLVCFRARNVHDAFEVIRTIDFEEDETIKMTNEQKPVGYRD